MRQLWLTFYQWMAWGKICLPSLPHLEFSRCKKHLCATTSHSQHPSKPSWTTYQSCRCLVSFDFENEIHVLAQAYRKYPVIIQEYGIYKLQEFEWGVIADYMNTPEKIKKGRQWMCNAQSEKVIGDRKSYWNRIRKRLCLIPVTGTIEHREVPGIKNKIPNFVKVKGRELFCIPGLYHYSLIPDVETGEVRGTFTLLTRAANSLMKRNNRGKY